MLIDTVTLSIAAGKGGDGVVRWRREKGIPYGGPAGGNGGRGGDVYFRVIRDITILRDYAHEKEFTAPTGSAGEKRSMHGKDGEDLYLRIPVGSTVYNREYDIRTDYTEEGDYKILKGGKGGLGNEMFKSSTNRAPEEFTKGELGEFATFDIELKLIADAGIIGFPNAGKTSLLNSLTRAGAKVGDYAFTTLEPNLGAYHGYVLADIPGLIEGAHTGKGLGHEFLRHITRTRVLVHLVAAHSDNVVTQYDNIRKELGSYNATLLEKEEVVILSQADTVTKEELEVKRRALKDRTKKEIRTLSLYDDASVKELGDSLIKTLQSS